jgi:hypothetical protein
MAREGMAGRRNAVLGLVILGHGLFVVLFLRPDVLTKVQVKKNASSLLLLELSIPTPPTNTVPPPKAVIKTPEAKKLPSPTDSTNVDSAAALDSSAIPSSDTPPSQPGIDWYQQAEQVANAQAESIFKDRKRACEEAALHGEHRPECRKYKKPDAWVPEPKKFGIAGGLPYVRLGKRCILGLGFFGCGVGKLPEANGRVFDDMREPDRPRSSVPDPNE